MTAQVKLTIAGFIALFAVLVTSFSALAASPDGSGPWADSVTSSSQGLRKDGSAVLPARSDTASALGVAENDTTEGNFYSLGFGGNIVLGFDNGIANGTIEVTEATNLPYPTETVKVEVSGNGSDWTDAGNVSQDGSVVVPEGIKCVKYVRLTDTSVAEDFSDDTADGFDVDGVKLVGGACETDEEECPDDCCTKVTQTNVTNVSNKISIKSNTGDNEIEDNVGGTSTITTGNITNNVNVKTTGGTNTSTGGGCCGGGSINVTISGNGEGSKNKVTINKSSKSKKSNKYSKNKYN